MNNATYYKKLWEEKTSGELNPKWSYKEDFNELKFFLNEKKYECLELGCGNGALYSVAKDYFSNYTGVDFSTSNIEIFKNNYPKLNLICKDIIKFRPKRRYSLIHSNQLIQYLNKNQLKELIKWNVDNIEKGGLILHRQIPDEKLMSLYFSGYLKPNINSVKLKRIMLPTLYRLYCLYKKTISSYSDFGFWYSVDDILKICNELNVKFDIYGSKLYRYRFNLLIRG